MTHDRHCTDHYRTYMYTRNSNPLPLLLSFLLQSQCTGFTLASEISIEAAFLLVENYQLTAPVGPRIGRESLETIVFVMPFIVEPASQALGFGEEHALE